MTRRKFKKVVSVILSATLMLSMAIGMPQISKAEESGGDITMFSGATEIGNRSWTKDDVTNTVYTNNTGSFVPAGEKYPARGPVKIDLNKPYMTRMAKTINYGSFSDPGPDAYYYFTLENAAKVTIYGRTSENDNSQMTFEKMSSTDSSFVESTNKIGLVKNNHKTKVINANLSAGSYLIQLSWGSTYPAKDCTQYSYVRVDVDYNINKDSDAEWYQLYPTWDKSSKSISTPYQIGKKMKCSTSVGDLDNYYVGDFAFHLDEKSELSLTEQTNVFDAFVQLSDHAVYINKTPAVFEAGDYVLSVSGEHGKTEYSFNTTATKVTEPVTAGVDTMATGGWSVSGETVTINNLNVNSGEYAEFCIWSGDKDNAGYGKGNAKLVIKGNCFIKTLVIDCPVEVKCESGAKLVVGNLVVNTANGKLTYTGGTTYNTATKTFEAACTHATQIIVGKKDATCKTTGYTGDTYCKICNTKLKSGSTIPVSSHKYDNGVITKQPTTTTEGVKTFTCSECGNTKTEAVAKLPDNSNNDKNPDDNQNTDDKQKEAEKQINNFATRMYTVVLNRNPDSSGLDTWTNGLKTGSMDGASLARGFICSEEFTNKNLSNEEFVHVLYETFFNREPDEGGKATWMGVLANNEPRTKVLAGFVNSKEFGGLCDDYGIARGTMEEDGSNIYNEGVRNFVLRNYTKALGRGGETEGVENWCYQINKGYMQPVEVARSFFHSEEFINKNLSDGDYVEVLYETFLGRASDPDGKAGWVSELQNGTNRDQVLDGFAYSQEFGNILQSFGLK